jgi:hypothetical protein
MLTRKKMMGAGERRKVTTCTTQVGWPELKNFRG